MEWILPDVGLVRTALDMAGQNKNFGAPLRTGRPTKFRKLVEPRTRKVKSARNYAPLAETLFNLIAEASGQGSASVSPRPHLTAYPRLPSAGLARTMHPTVAIAPHPRS